MSLHKIVNGTKVNLTKDEEAKVLAEWAAEDAKDPEPLPPTIDEKINAIAEMLNGDDTNFKNIFKKNGQRKISN